MSKKSYMSLLKEAIAEFDTSDTVEVKGPMLDPILSWNGNGEIPVYKDAASILERYYFNEKRDDGVRTLDEADYENDKGEPASGEAMKNAEGAGTEQAGTSDAGSIKGGKADKEKDIAKESEEVAAEGDVAEQEWSDKDVPPAKEYTDESLEMENAIIEKLIAEMEDDDADDEDGDDEDMNEMDMTYTGQGPKETMPKEKEAKDPEQDAQGAGTQQAGTGMANGQVPDRKDMHDKMVKPKEYTDENTQIEEALAQLERELMEADDMDADEGDKDEKLDVDKEVASEAASAVPGGPSPKKTGEDWEDDEKYYAEAFEIFKNAIREQDEEDTDKEEDEDELKKSK